MPRPQRQCQRLLRRPQLLLPLLRQLVSDVGVAPSDIYVYDAIRNIPSTLFDRASKEFPGMHFVDSTNTDGREKAVPDATKPLYLGQGNVTLYFPTCLTQADYLINIAGLKGPHPGQHDCVRQESPRLPAHRAGRRRCRPNASLHRRQGRRTRGRPQAAGAYNGLVDLGGHPQTGGKTLLYIVDAIYATQHNEFRLATACKWTSAPFNGHWTSSIFASQDGVAIDSVALDFLRNEPTISPTVMGPVDNYLHEMALADKGAFQNRL